jgi:hypothetical protein
MMAWVVAFCEAEFDAFPGEVQDAILARVNLLEREGPQLGRPHADTLKGSGHTNMKELRCPAANWRVAYAFDPSRRAIFLAGGDKSGGSEKRFYRRLIAKADERFDQHLAGRKG